MDSIPTEILERFFQYSEDRTIVNSIFVCRLWRLVAGNVLHRRVTDPAANHPMLDIYVQKLSMDEYMEDWRKRIVRNAVHSELVSRERFVQEREKEVAELEFLRLMEESQEITLIPLEELDYESTHESDYNDLSDTTMDNISSDDDIPDDVECAEK